MRHARLFAAPCRRLLPLLVWMVGLAACAKEEAPEAPVEPLGVEATADLVTRLTGSIEALQRAAQVYENTDRRVMTRWFGNGEGDDDAAIRQSQDQVEAALQQAADDLWETQALLDVPEEGRQHVMVVRPRGSSPGTPTAWRDAAEKLDKALLLLAEASEERPPADLREELEGLVAECFEKAEAGVDEDAWITGSVDVAAVLLCILGLLFTLNANPRTRKLFHIIPLLVFAYFVPTVVSNVGIIPVKCDLYSFIKDALLPASLVLLVLAVDVKAVFRLGKDALVLFFAATISIILGGPLALLAFGWMIPESVQDEAWRGLAALSGSWIGGGANFVGIGESVGASPSTMSMMVVVDVAIAELWMVFLLFFAGREKKMDEKIGADRTSLEEVRERIEQFERQVSRPTTLADVLVLFMLAIGITAIATALAGPLGVYQKEHWPFLDDVTSKFTWIVLIVTTLALAMSFTPLRRLEGAGASKFGSALLYLLVASIGAKARFSKVLEVPSLMVIGAAWMIFHVTVIMWVRRWLKAPIFFAAVGSKANVGGAASAPILASAFHPSLAPVGVLLAIFGYACGTYGGILCAALLRWVNGLL